MPYYLEQVNFSDVHEQIDELAVQLSKKENIDYEQALARVLRQHPTLSRAYLGVELSEQAAAPALEAPDRPLEPTSASVRLSVPRGGTRAELSAHLDAAVLQLVRRASLSYEEALLKVLQSNKELAKAYFA